MQVVNDLEIDAMSRSEFKNFLERVRSVTIGDSWPTIGGPRFHQWRWTEIEYIPPFAFWMRWRGSDKLSDEQEEWLRSRKAFGQVWEIPFVGKSDSQITNRVLVVFDMQAQQKGMMMYHATPSIHLASVLRTGLKPGRLTGVSTTNFPESRRWIHLFESYSHATDKFLLHPKNSERIQLGKYTILKIDTAGIGEILCDPFSDHGFITEAEVIAPQYISVIDEVAVVQQTDSTPRLQAIQQRDETH